MATVCKHLTTVCNNCKKRGHLARVCKSGKAMQWKPAGQPKQSATTSKQPSETNRFVVTETTSTADEEVEDDGAYEVMKTIRNQGEEPIMMDITLNDIPVQMELDTGASVSVIN